MRFLARYFKHYVWLALAATVIAVVSWIITVVPLSPTPIAFGIKFGLAISVPLNFLIISFRSPITRSPTVPMG